MAFDHEDLMVYQKSLRFAARAKGCIEDWASSYAIKDHFGRAARSIPVNLAAGTMQRSVSATASRYDIALGSTLECAACVDVARIYGLLPTKAAINAKHRLLEIARMTVGLRKSTQAPEIREEQTEYVTDERGAEPWFSHEGLNVYQVGLEFTGWLWGLFCANDALPGGMFQELDTASAGIVLNIAEGNGRFHEKDQRRFLGFAQDAAVKAATSLDIAVLEDEVEGKEATHAKNLLERIAAMLFQMIGRDSYE